ncbi:MAG: hypothetical protein RL885_06405 [Planctomycetota bacterium]
MRRLAVFFIVFLTGLAILFIVIDPSDIGTSRKKPSGLGETRETSSSTELEPADLGPLKDKAGDELGNVVSASSSGFRIDELSPFPGPEGPIDLFVERIRLGQFGQDPASDQFTLVREVRWESWERNERGELEMYGILTAERARIEIGDRQSRRSNPGEDVSPSTTDFENAYFLGPVVIEMWTPPSDDVDAFSRDPVGLGVPTRLETSDLQLYGTRSFMSTESDVRIVHGLDEELELTGSGLEAYGWPFLDEEERSELKKALEPGESVDASSVLILQKDIRLVDRRGLDQVELPGLTVDTKGEPLVVTGDGPLSIFDRSQRAPEALNVPPVLDAFLARLSQNVRLECGESVSLTCDRIECLFRAASRKDEGTSPDVQPTESSDEGLSLEGHLEWLQAEGRPRFRLGTIRGDSETFELELEEPRDRESPPRVKRLELIGSPKISGLPADDWVEKLAAHEADAEDSVPKEDPKNTDETKEETSQEESVPDRATGAGAALSGSTATVSAIDRIRMEQIGPSLWKVVGMVGSRLRIEPDRPEVDSARAHLNGETIVLVFDEKESELRSLLAETSAEAGASGLESGKLRSFTIRGEGISFDLGVEPGSRSLKVWPKPEFEAVLRDLQLPKELGEPLAAPSEPQSPTPPETPTAALYLLEGSAQGELTVLYDDRGWRRVDVPSSVAVDIQKEGESESTHLEAAGLVHEQWPENDPIWPLGRRHTRLDDDVLFRSFEAGVTARGTSLDLVSEGNDETEESEWLLRGAPAELQIESKEGGTNAHIFAWESIRFLSSPSKQRLVATGSASTRLELPIDAEAMQTARPFGSLLAKRIDPTNGPRKVFIDGELITVDLGAKVDPDATTSENPVAGLSDLEGLLASGNVRVWLANENIEFTGELLEARDGLRGLDLYGGSLGRAAVRQTDDSKSVLWAQDLSIDLEAERMNLFGGGELVVPGDSFGSLFPQSDSGRDVPARITFGRNGVIDPRQARFDGGIELMLASSGDDARLRCEETVIDFERAGAAAGPVPVRRIEAIRSVEIDGTVPQRIRGRAERLLWDVPTGAIGMQGGPRRVSVTFDSHRYETVPGGSLTIFYLDGGVRSTAGGIVETSEDLPLQRGITGRR